MNAMTHPVERAAEAASRSREAKRSGLFGDPLLLGGFVVFIVLNVALAFRYNINWDEYYYLSQVYSAGEGRPLAPLQTIHVHLFGWLTALPLTEADQIVVGRLVMGLCQAASVACLYRIAREFAGRRDAAFAAFAYLASGYVLAHGISFRTDPLAGALMMAALAVLFCAPLRWWAAAAAGMLAAMAFMVTMKVVFFAPAAAAAFLWRWHQAGRVRSALVHFALAGAVAAAAGAALFLAHAESLAVAAASGSSETGALVRPAADSAGKALDKVILSQGLFPRAAAIVDWLLLSGFPLILVALGASSALAMVRKGERLRGAALLCLLLPLVTLVFYRNAFAYFFPFLFLPAAILAAPGAARLTGTRSRRILLAAMVLVLVGQAAALWQRDQSVQRGVARAVHAIFPEPVPYIDRNGMVPSFPKANLLMSTWGIEAMLARGRPALVPIIEQHQPPLLIENSRTLTAALEPTPSFTGLRLHPADEQALRDSYIRHWGPVWVAGKTLGQAAGTFDLAIAGTYTLECAGARSIDGGALPCGSTVALAQGMHEWTGGRAVLRWGEHLPRPSGTLPWKPIYYGL